MLPLPYSALSVFDTAPFQQVMSCASARSNSQELEVSVAMHGRRQGEARRAFYCSTTMANTQTNIVEWCSLVVERADKLREVVGPGGVPEAGVVMVLLCKTLPEFEELRLRLDYELGLDVPTVTKELMDFAKLRGITDIRGKYSSPMQGCSREAS